MVRSTRGWIGWGRKFYKFIFLSAGKFIRLSNNFSVLTHPCNVHFTMFNFAVYYIFEYKFNDMEDVNTVF